jgi:hypothetical protein
MDFTDADIRAFILEQREELAQHRAYLRDVLGIHLSDPEAAADWAGRYAAEYREIGTRLLVALGPHPRRAELFAAGMAEIMRHKYVESYRAGRDLGLRAAGEDWLARFSAGWIADKGRVT